ncbi:MAG: hypothetical protein ABSA77_11615, partial [Thermoguttaceae bacterium]|jgi:hypothetical protein
LPAGRQTAKNFIFLALATLFLGTWNTSAQEPDESAPPSLPQMLPDAMPEIPAWAGKDKDEPFDVKKFLESRTVAPSDNAAPLYFWALADVSNNMAFVYPPDQWKARLPRVEALGRDIGNMADDEKLKAGSIPITEIERVLKDARPTLDKIDQAQQKKRCVFVTGIRFDSRLEHIQAARQIARLEILQIYHACSKDDFAEAEQAIKRTLRLSRDLRPRGLFVNQLVSYAVEGIILDAITNYTLTQRSLTPEQCDRLLALLADRDRLIKAALSEGLKMEYIAIRNTFNDVQTGRLKRDLFKSLGSIQLTEEQFKQINWRKEISALNRTFAKMFAIADKPYDKSALDDFNNKELPKLKAEKNVLTPLLLPAMSAVFTAQSRMQARVAGTQCLIVVCRYILAHDKLPTDLAAAITEAGLKEIPLDPFDGKPMRYKVIDGKPVVYSVGPDQKDDGATVEWTGQNSSGDMIYRIGE